MVRSLGARCLRHVSTARISPAPRYQRHRTISSNASPKAKLPAPSPTPTAATTHSPSWLTRKVQSSKTAMTFFLGLNKLLGYGSVKQVAARRTLFMYESLCMPRADEDAEFWRNSCHLPPTFQSWFTITNLHIWLLTVRFRALPPPDGTYFIQGLIDHFFIDVEDRIRSVLQPQPNAPPLPHSLYYTPPSAPTNGASVTKKGSAPDRLVTQQMKIFKEQWAGMGMTFDLGLVKGDMEMAGAVWRNLLGARGARGIVYHDPSSPSTTHFRRSVNLVGGSDAEIKKLAKVGLEAEEARDDNSGVHDFPPEESDKYVEYPQVMLDVVEYVRRELVRLEKIPDGVIAQGDLSLLKFGAVKRGSA